MTPFAKCCGVELSMVNKGTQKAVNNNLERNSFLECSVCGDEYHLRLQLYRMTTDHQHKYRQTKRRHLQVVP